MHLVAVVGPCITECRPTSRMSYASTCLRAILLQYCPTTSIIDPWLTPQIKKPRVGSRMSPNNLCDAPDLRTKKQAKACARRQRPAVHTSAVINMRARVATYPSWSRDGHLDHRVLPRCSATTDGRGCCQVAPWIASKLDNRGGRGIFRTAAAAVALFFQRQVVNLGGVCTRRVSPVPSANT